jgi:hypothetical protein
MVRGAAAKIDRGATFQESLKVSLGADSIAKQPVVSPSDRDVPDKTAEAIPEPKISTPVKGAVVGVEAAAPKANRKPKTAGKVEGDDALAKGGAPVPQAEGQSLVAASLLPVAVAADGPVPVVVEDTAKVPVGDAAQVEAPANAGLKASASVAKVNDKGVKAEAKKVEVAGSAIEPRTSADLVVVVPPVLRHELARVETGTGGSGAAIVAASGGHVMSAPATASTIKSAEVGVTAPVAEVAVQASDLKTLTATPNVLEVGIASGSHGWLRVRAELGPAGEVAASVSAASAGAAEGLHKELPAISAYLAEERVGVGSLVVHAMERGAGAQDSAMNAGTGAAGSRAGSGQRDKDLSFAMQEGRRGGGVVDTELSGGLDAVSQPWMSHGNGSGGWVSVRV